MKYVGFERKLTGGILCLNWKGSVFVADNLNTCSRVIIRSNLTILDKLKNLWMAHKYNASIFKVSVSELTNFEVIDSLGRRSGVVKTICFKDSLQGDNKPFRVYTVTSESARGGNKSIIFDDGRVMIKGIGDFELSDFYEISFN